MRRPSPPVPTSLALGLALALAAFGGSGCGGGAVDGRARAHAAARLGLAASDLRVTERSALSTDRHAVLRVTRKGASNGAALLTVVVPRAGGAIFDSQTQGAFARLASAEALAKRYDTIGGKRVAGWFGAFGDGRPCGEPYDDGSLSPVAARELPEGARELTWTFARERGTSVCTLELAADGTVRRAAAKEPPVAAK